MACTKKHSNSLDGSYRVLTLEEKKKLNWGHVYIKADCGHFLIVKVNGAAKTWKRNPKKVMIPYKYGMYEFGYITESDEVRVPV